MFIQLYLKSYEFYYATPIIKDGSRSYHLYYKSIYSGYL
jgi:hypothetical protein